MTTVESRCYGKFLTGNGDHTSPFPAAQVRSTAGLPCLLCIYGAGRVCTSTDTQWNFSFFLTNVEFSTKLQISLAVTVIGNNKKLTAPPPPLDALLKNIATMEVGDSSLPFPQHSEQVRSIKNRYFFRYFQFNKVASNHMYLVTLKWDSDSKRKWHVAIVSSNCWPYAASCIASQDNETSDGVCAWGKSEEWVQKVWSVGPEKLLHMPLVADPIKLYPKDGKIIYICIYLYL